MRVTLIAAQSLDGFITRHDLPGSDFASAEDQAHLRAALARFDCSIMGATTYRIARESIRPHLATPGRLRTVLTRTPAFYAADAAPGALEFSSHAPARLLAELSRRGHTRCALLGGSQIHSLFLQAGLVNELWLTIEPVLFGRGTPLLAEKADCRLRLLACDALSPDTRLMKYEVLT
jgi:dihydrofolate reductase